MTDSGKFIEVERGDVIDNLPIDNTDAIDNANTEKKMATSPPQSPAKSVRIKENGTKTNGEDAHVSFLLECFIFWFL